MYPGPTGAAENHKRGYCSDGVKQVMEQSKQNQDPPQPNQSVSVTPPEWPQPQGIFFNGTQFHPLAFLDKIREMYEKVVIEKASGDLLMEHEAFAWLLMRRTVVLEDRSVVFKMFDLVCPASTADTLVVVREGDNYLCLDCLRDSAWRRFDPRFIDAHVSPHSSLTSYFFSQWTIFRAVHISYVPFMFVRTAICIYLYSVFCVR